MYSVETVFGGHKTLGVKGSFSFEDVIQQGFPLPAGEHFKREVGISEKLLAEVMGLSISTLMRLKKKRARMSSVASNRLYRFAQIFVALVNVLGDVEEAKSWLDSSHIELDGRTPLEKMRTEVGAQEVEKIIGKIQYGIGL